MCFAVLFVFLDLLDVGLRGVELLGEVVDGLGGVDGEHALGQILGRRRDDARHLAHRRALGFELGLDGAGHQIRFRDVLAHLLLAGDPGLGDAGHRLDDAVGVEREPRRVFVQPQIFAVLEPGRRVFLQKLGERRLGLLGLLLEFGLELLALVLERGLAILDGSVVARHHRQRVHVAFSFRKD